jgi:formate dehydrogenase major subunit
VPGLGTSFGRGGATTAQQDLANANCILIEGSSMAEAHPVGFRWVMKAKERGATIIHVDPRFSRTSALADLWVPIRAGSDIAFLGGLVRHMIEHERYFREYVVRYTNASCILRESFADTEDCGGFFTGWDEEKRAYKPEDWLYEGNGLSYPKRDLTLKHPRCVFQVLRRHFSRYTPEMVEKICGIPPALFLRVADQLAQASGPGKTAAICYAVGWTQHSKGVQVIRCAAVLQLLLGNIGRPGGGIMALRGHASIQGSTDIPTLYDTLPGYLAMPRAGKGEETLQDYLDKHTNQTGLWHQFPAYFISLLKSYYGQRATAENDFGYSWLPKITEDHSYLRYLYAMLDGNVEGFFVMGQNPVVGGPNGRLARKALSRVKWMVVRDLVEIETASFWRNSPEIERGELRTEDIETEVFLMPAAGHAEKEGSFTNTQRLLQWREKAVDPPGDCKSESWFMHQLARRLIAKANASSDPIDEPLRALDWWYPETAEGEPKMEAVLAEINGWQTKPNPVGEGVVFAHDIRGLPHHGPQIDGYTQLKPDGSTASGCWIYAGVYADDCVNKARKRDARGVLGHGWGFAWPGDRRILYNRASAAPDGRPWSSQKQLIWWDPKQHKWVGDDHPDLPVNKSPDYRGGRHDKGLDALPGDAPFILHEDGLGWLYIPEGLQDGPMPTHYEPLESPVFNKLYPRNTNPPVNWFTGPENRLAPPADPHFPYVLTTYRLTEHHTAGGMSRFLPHLGELQPAMFVELSPELAHELRIRNADYVCLITFRGAIEARALVSRRIRPLRLNGTTIHQVAIPFHFGVCGLVQGDSANDLVAISGEPNVTIMETKSLLCNLVPGRLPRGPAYLARFKQFVPDDAPKHPHPEQPPPGAPPGGHLTPGHGQHGKSV